MPRKALRFFGRVLVLLVVLLGPLTAMIAVATLFPAVDGGLTKLLLLCSGVWLMSALLLTPAILFPESGHLPEPPGGDGGGGNDPPEPPAEPSAPRGGVPMADAEQARERVRDHDRPQRRPSRRRRFAREPKRPSTPANP